MKHPNGSQVILPSQTEDDEFLEDPVKEVSSCCDIPKISKEDGFFVCLNCGSVNSRVLLEAGWGDPNLHEDDPWVEICGYYDREKLNNSKSVPNLNDSLDESPRRLFTPPDQEDEPF
jgi:hypothetical protein